MLKERVERIAAVLTHLHSSVASNTDVPLTSRKIILDDISRRRHSILNGVRFRGSNSCDICFRGLNLEVARETISGDFRLHLRLDSNCQDRPLLKAFRAAADRHNLSPRSRPPVHLPPLPPPPSSRVFSPRFQKHAFWFQFEVWNLVPGRPYRFQIVNVSKSRLRRRSRSRPRSNVQVDSNSDFDANESEENDDDYLAVCSRTCSVYSHSQIPQKWSSWCRTDCSNVTYVPTQDQSSLITRRRLCPHTLSWDFFLPKQKQVVAAVSPPVVVEFGLTVPYGWYDWVSDWENALKRLGVSNRIRSVIRMRGPCSCSCVVAKKGSRSPRHCQGHRPSVCCRRRREKTGKWSPVILENGLNVHQTALCDSIAGVPVDVVRISGGDEMNSKGLREGGKLELPPIMTRFRPRPRRSSSFHLSRESVCLPWENRCQFPRRRLSVPKAEGFRKMSSPMKRPDSASPPRFRPCPLFRETEKKRHRDDSPSHLRLPRSSLRSCCQRVVVITSRVHPGESTASFAMRGILNLLLDRNSILARELRSRFIFYLIPMLNPDGVLIHNHRTNLAGFDLNRVWDSPHPLIHPTIWHAKSLIQRLHREVGVYCYFDLHGHAKKDFVFCIANNRKNGLLRSIAQSLVRLSCAAEELSESRMENEIRKRIVTNPRKKSCARFVLGDELGIANAFTVETPYFARTGFDQVDMYDSAGVALLEGLLGYQKPSEFPPSPPPTPIFSPPTPNFTDLSPFLDEPQVVEETQPRFPSTSSPSSAFEESADSPLKDPEEVVQPCWTLTTMLSWFVWIFVAVASLWWGRILFDVAATILCDFILGAGSDVGKALPTIFLCSDN